MTTLSTCGILPQLTFVQTPSQSPPGKRQSGNEKGLSLTALPRVSRAQSRGRLDLCWALSFSWGLGYTHSSLGVLSFTLARPRTLLTVERIPFLRGSDFVHSDQGPHLPESPKRQMRRHHIAQTPGVALGGYHLPSPPLHPTSPQTLGSLPASQNAGSRDCALGPGCIPGAPIGYSCSLLSGLALSLCLLPGILYLSPLEKDPTSPRTPHFPTHDRKERAT